MFVLCLKYTKTNDASHMNFKFIEFIVGQTSQVHNLDGSCENLWSFSIPLDYRLRTREQIALFNQRAHKISYRKVNISYFTHVLNLLFYNRNYDFRSFFQYYFNIYVHCFVKVFCVSDWRISIFTNFHGYLGKLNGCTMSEGYQVLSKLISLK